MKWLILTTRYGRDPSVDELAIATNEIFHETQDGMTEADAHRLMPPSLREPLPLIDSACFVSDNLNPCLTWFPSDFSQQVRVAEPRTLPCYEN